VAAHHPETVQLAPRRLWSRHPMGPLIGSLGIALQQAASSDGLCCPGPAAVKVGGLYSAESKLNHSA
jgi:hypothetical protein